MRFLGGLAADLRVGLVDDRKPVVLVNVGTPGDSKVRRTSGHSHHIAVNEIIEVHIQYLLAEIVLDQTHQDRQARVGRNIDNV